MLAGAFGGVKIVDHDVQAKRLPSLALLGVEIFDRDGDFRGVPFSRSDGSKLHAWGNVFPLVNDQLVGLGVGTEGKEEDVFGIFKVAVLGTLRIGAGVEANFDAILLPRVELGIEDGFVVRNADGDI